MTLEKLKHALAAVPSGDQPFALLVNCLEMDSYDGEARSHFVGWNSQQSERILKVAVVTNRVLWHMVVSAMSFASRQKMRPFDCIEEAQEWLEEAE